MKRAGITHTNLCFFSSPVWKCLYTFEHIVPIDSTKTKKCNKKLYGVDIKQFETLKWWRAQKPTPNTKNTHTDRKLTVWTSSCYEPLEAIFFAEKCHRLRVSKMQLKCAEGVYMQEPTPRPSRVCRNLRPFPLGSWYICSGVTFSSSVSIFAIALFLLRNFVIGSFPFITLLPSLWAWHIAFRRLRYCRNFTAEYRRSGVFWWLFFLALSSIVAAIAWNWALQPV